MARHDEPADAGRGVAERSHGVQELRLLALARAGEHHDGPAQRGAPAAALRELRRIGRGVELEVAEHALDVGSGRAQPLGIGFGLRPRRREAAIRGTRQPRQPPRLRQRLFAQARVGQHQRHVPGAAFGHEVGPDLGLHQHPGTGPEVVQEAPHGARRVPRQPGLPVAGAQQALAFGPAGGGAVRQQHAQGRLALAQALQQDRGGARFAERHGVDPQRTRFGRRAVLPETFLHRVQVAGLGRAAAAQLAAQERLRPEQHERVERPDHAVLTSRHACHTASTDGVGAAYTDCWRGRPGPGSGPVRHAVSKL